MDARFDGSDYTGKVVSEENQVVQLANDFGLDVVGRSAAELEEALLQVIVERDLLPADADLLIVKRMRSALLRATRLLAAHRPGRVDAPIVYFCASDNDCDDVTGMLAAVTDGNVAVIDVSAKHSALFLPEPLIFIGYDTDRYLGVSVSE